MKNLWGKVKGFLQQNKKYILTACIVYALHLSIEGLAVNLIWFKLIKPALLSL